MVVKDQDRESVGDFYGVSMDILNNVTHAPRSLSITEEDSKFSITPKKIKIVSETFFHTRKWWYRILYCFSLARKHNELGFPCNVCSLVSYTRILTTYQEYSYILKIYIL